VSLLSVFGMAAFAFVTLWVWRERLNVRDQEIDRDPLRIVVRTIKNQKWWQQWPAAARLLSQKEWPDRELLAVLEDLFEQIVEEDNAKVRHGRDSNSFRFYDAGFARICERLRDRLGLPQRWVKRKSAAPYRD
jgi:hypothetical protein